jgi:hypothetical protein
LKRDSYTLTATSAPKRRRLALSQHTTLVGEGKANFNDETLDMRLVARPKDTSLVSLRGPINVAGTFANPTVMLDLPRLGARGVAAARGRSFHPARRRSGRAVRSARAVGAAADPFAGAAAAPALGNEAVS